MSKDNGGPASDRELLEMAANASAIKKWDDGYPDWKDSGKLVTILLDGKETTGVLCYDDWASDDDGDEFPLWLVRVPGAQDECFAAADKWRFEVIVAVGYHRGEVDFMAESAYDCADAMIARRSK